MSMDIYYFSGTGNSLFIARELAKRINDEVNIIAIASLLDYKQIKITADAIGFVFPVYFQTIPDILKDFIGKIRYGKIRSGKKPYTFAVATCNTAPGHSLFTLDKNLKKIGLSLCSGFTVDMPGNSLIIRDFTNPADVRQLRLFESRKRIAEISGCINNRRVLKPEGSDKIKYHLQGLVTGTVAKHIYKTPGKFTITGKCNNCRVCEQICPTKNITMSPDNNRRWGNNCEQCLACFHWCPRKAIEIGNSTADKQRYTHPDISIKDMIIREIIR